MAHRYAPLEEQGVDISAVKRAKSKLSNIADCLLDLYQERGVQWVQLKKIIPIPGKDKWEIIAENDDSYLFWEWSGPGDWEMWPMPKDETDEYLAAHAAKPPELVAVQNAAEIDERVCRTRRAVIAIIIAFGVGTSGARVVMDILNWLNKKK
jgi:hypothetical protein